MLVWFGRESGQISRKKLLRLAEAKDATNRTRHMFSTAGLVCSTDGEHESVPARCSYKQRRLPCSVNQQTAPFLQPQYGKVGATLTSTHLRWIVCYICHPPGVAPSTTVLRRWHRLHLSSRFVCGPRVHHPLSSSAPLLSLMMDRICAPSTIRGIGSSTGRFPTMLTSATAFSSTSSLVDAAGLATISAFVARPCCDLYCRCCCFRDKHRCLGIQSPHDSHNPEHESNKPRWCVHDAHSPPWCACVCEK